MRNVPVYGSTNITVAGARPEWKKMRKASRNLENNLSKRESCCKLRNDGKDRRCCFRATEEYGARLFPPYATREDRKILLS